RHPDPFPGRGTRCRLSEAQSVARFGCKEPPASQIAWRTEGILLLILHGAHRVLPGLPTYLTGCPPWSSPPPSGSPLLLLASASLPLRRRGVCRRNAARRLLDEVQPQLACLPPQRLELLLPHPGLVLLLTLTHVRQAVLE